MAETKRNLGNLFRNMISKRKTKKNRELYLEAIRIQLRYDCDYLEARYLADMLYIKYESEMYRIRVTRLINELAEMYYKFQEN